MQNAILSVNNLHTYFYTRSAVVQAVRGVSFHVPERQTVAIVGESGSGKSITAMSIMRLVSSPGRVVEGSVLLNGENLLQKSVREMRRIRGKSISMIFQEPMSSLNPVYTCGEQVMEAVRLHDGVSRAEAKNRAIEMFQLVGIPAPEKRIYEYPDQLSGGMRQRVMIAMALACHPRLLIADEPTTALDVTIQAQILDLMAKLQSELGMSILFITHDFGVVAEIAHHVVVMYGGEIVEQGPVLDIFDRPQHPYTRGLLNSIPKVDGPGKHAGQKLYAMPGSVPEPGANPAGCGFRPRCAHAMPMCESVHPEDFEVGAGHTARCWLYAKDGSGVDQDGEARRSPASQEIL